MLTPVALTSATGPQARLAYDATHYTDFTTGATGVLTIAPSGGAVTITGAASFASGCVINGFGAGTFRDDTGLEIINPISAGLSLLQNANPGNTSNEGFIAYGARDTAGVVQKTASISSMWANATAGSQKGTLRLNVTYWNGAAVDNDIAMRLFGGDGIEMFGSSETTGPGMHVFKVSGAVVFTGAATLGSTLAVTGAATLSSTLTVTGISTLSGHVIAGTIRCGTSDGSDNSNLDLAGGGAAADVTRGAWIRLNGNEAGNPGSVQISGGNVSGGHILLYTGNLLERGRMTDAGVFLVGTTDSTSAAAGAVRVANALWIGDGITAPTAASGFAAIYVDGADGDLKVKFGDGTVKTISVDT